MFVNGVSIILTGSKKEASGMAIAWVSQVEKSHLVISVPKNCDATNVLMKHGTFSVNELGLGQEGIARAFGGKNCTKDSVQNSTHTEINITETQCGLPMLSECRKSVICKTVLVNEIKEQVIITAEILETINKADMSPMIFIKSDFFNDN